MTIDPPGAPCPSTPRSASDRVLVAAVMLVALVSALSGVLSGCASPGAMPPPAKVTPPAALGLQDAPTTPADARWWQALGDPALDALVDRALEAQPTLRVAAARLNQARAVAEARGAADGPRLDLAVDATRQRYSEHGIFPPPLAGGYYNLGNVTAQGSWELDFFGRNRAALQAALGTERAATADLAAARTLLAAQVARSYVGLARLIDQREVARRTLAQREELLGLIGQRVRAGLDTNVELRQGEAAPPEARSQIEALDEQIALARHQLAALTAQAPAALDGLAPRLAELRLVPLPDGLGADLLGRRPDVQAARWRVEAATQGEAAARAEFYPDVRLSAFVGLNALGLNHLFDIGSRTVGIGPALHLPLFDAGRLRAQLHGRRVDLDAAIEQYNSAVLDAVRETADAMTSQASLVRQRSEQALAQAGVEQAYDLAAQRYKAGLASYLVVLTAETQLLAQRRLALDLQARALEVQVALNRSLGGGWSEPATSLAAAPAPRAP
ncbi:MAG: efflux transporter outer membrane subunit [Burkholderiales bacterium]